MHSQTPLKKIKSPRRGRMTSSSKSSVDRNFAALPITAGLVATTSHLRRPSRQSTR
ncbi:hypothetical protein ACHAXS_011115 [Conticribra weissflogii]